MTASSVSGMAAGTLDRIAVALLGATAFWPACPSVHSAMLRKDLRARS